MDLNQGTTPIGARQAPRSAPPTYTPPSATTQYAPVQQPSGYIPPQEAVPAKQVPADTAEVIKTCGSWSEFFRCPLIIYSVLAFIFFIADIWALWRASSEPGVTSSFWVTGILSILIYVIFIFLFGYWIKKKCEDCQTGQSWLIFLLAIFFPIILGFAINVIIGAFAGGLAYLSTSLGRGKSGSAAKNTKAPAPASGAPTSNNPAGTPVTPGVGLVPQGAATQQAAAVSTTAAQQAVQNVAQQAQQAASNVFNQLGRMAV